MQGIILATDVTEVPFKNGEPAFENQVYDSDGDQIPDFTLNRAFPIHHPGQLFLSTSLNVYLTKGALPNYAEPFFWPYLDFVDPEQPENSQESAGNDPPPVKFNWKDSRIIGVGGFLPGWSQGDRWVANPINDLLKGATNILDWEIFSNYDFNHDDMEDMILRDFYYPQAPVQIADRILYLQMENYSWHHQFIDTQKWDYKLELAGLREMPASVIAFPDFSIYAVPYEERLSKYTRQEDWAYATFVAAEGYRYDSSEGIWEWSTLGGVVTDIFGGRGGNVPDSNAAQRSYLLGNSDSSPASFYYTIRPGFRGEYADLNGPPGLYFSPIDHKLHLLRASKGVWVLDGKREIRYRNLGGETIHQWSLIQGENELKTFISTPEYLLLLQDDQVKIMQAGISPILFTTLPPSNEEEWAKLGQDLEKNKPTFAVDDFEAMLQQFSGPTLTIEAANLSDFRLTQHGFRFTLNLLPDYQLQGAELLDIQDLAPGTYLVQYENSGPFRIVPLGSPSLQITVPANGILAEPGIAFSPNTLRVNLVNKGLADARVVTLSAKLILDDGTPINIGEKTTRVNGESTQEVRFDWIPKQAGASHVVIQAIAYGGQAPQGIQATAEHVEVIQIQDELKGTFMQTASAFGLVNIYPLLLLLIAIALISGLLVACIFKFS